MAFHTIPDLVQISKLWYALNRPKRDSFIFEFCISSSMARRCDICLRGPVKKTDRSHSNIASRRWVLPNVQKKTIAGKRVTICTRCIKTRTKQQAEK